VKTGGGQGAILVLPPFRRDEELEDASSATGIQEKYRKD